MKKIKFVCLMVIFYCLLGVLTNIQAQVVINEIYGGAGCGTANCSTYGNDFIELRNNGASSVDVTGWSVQYSSATGSGWAVTTLTGMIPAGNSFLIGQSGNANGINALPTPNVSDTTAMSATAGKVALVNNSTQLTGTCPISESIIDFVGYGATANCNEGGTNAPAPSTTTSISRSLGADTDVNGTDFTTGAPTPQASGASAASGTVAGRVRDGKGNGLKFVTVMITGGGLDEPLYATTNQFGKYLFEDIPVGADYVLQVFSRRHTFEEQSRIISLKDFIEDADFIGRER